MSGLTTELQALNEVLSVAGDASVTSLTTDYEAAIIARRILDETSRDEQSNGWWFNELEELDILPDVNGSVTLPANVIQATIIGDSGSLVQRGRRIFDRSNNTYVISETVTVDLIEFLSWEELPQVFRQYVTQLSKSRYNTEYFGSNDVETILAQSISKYTVLLRKADVEARDINMFNNSRVNNIAFKNRR